MKNLFPVESNTVDIKGYLSAPEGDLECSTRDLHGAMFKNKFSKVFFGRLSIALSFHLSAI